MHNDRQRQTTTLTDAHSTSLAALFPSEPRSNSTLSKLMMTTWPEPTLQLMRLLLRALVHFALPRKEVRDVWGLELRFCVRVCIGTAVSPSSG